MSNASDFDTPNSGSNSSSQSSQNNNNTGPNIKELLEKGNIWDDIPDKKEENTQKTQENTGQIKSVNEQIAEHLKPFNIDITEEMASNPAMISETINKSMQGMFTEAIRLMSSATKETVNNTKKEVTTELSQQRANEQFMSNLSNQVPLMNDPLLKPILTTLAGKLVQRGISEKDLPKHLQATILRIGELVNEGGDNPRNKSNSNKTSGIVTPQSTDEWLKALTEDD